MDCKFAQKTLGTFIVLWSVQTYQPMISIKDGIILIIPIRVFYINLALIALSLKVPDNYIYSGKFELIIVNWRRYYIINSFILELDFRISKTLLYYDSYLIF